MCGRHDDAVAALERVYGMRAAAGEVDAAATAAFWLFTSFLYAGEVARAGGWVARMRDLNEELGADGEPGWLLVTGAYRCIGAGQLGEARALLSDAAAQGRRRGNVDVTTFATMLTGRALLKEGRIEEGLGRLDEAMLRIVAAETSPRVTSTLYCSGIGTCEEEALDFARAREWALALERWMADLPSASSGALLNHCRVYRAVLMRRRGDVQQSLTELDALHRAHSQKGPEPWSPATRATSWARPTGCSATTTMRTRPIAGRSAWGGAPSRVSRCCDSVRERCPRPRPASGGHLPRPSEGRTAAACSRRP
jgi:hypothetical protein